MEPLLIEATKSSPKIEFNQNTETYRIEGQSYPENIVIFFTPIFEWVNKFLITLDKPATFDINLTYINTSSSKAMMMLFDLFEEAFSKGSSISVNWYYHKENEMGLEYGQEFKEDLSFPFNIIEIED